MPPSTSQVSYLPLHGLGNGGTGYLFLPSWDPKTAMQILVVFKDRKKKISPLPGRSSQPPEKNIFRKLLIPGDREGGQSGGVLWAVEIRPTASVASGQHQKAPLNAFKKVPLGTYRTKGMKGCVEGGRWDRYGPGLQQGNQDSRKC